MRLGVLTILLAAICLTAAPASAGSAAQPGQILTRPGAVAGITGSCSCLDRWYTAGFRPSRIRFDASLARCAARTYKVCTLSVYLLRGRARSMVKQLTLHCASRKCGQTGRIALTIRHAGVYHLMVHGEGAGSIDFLLHVRGAMYPVHCRASC